MNWVGLFTGIVFAIIVNSAVLYFLVVTGDRGNALQCQQPRADHDPMEASDETMDQQRVVERHGN